VSLQSLCNDTISIQRKGSAPATALNLGGHDSTFSTVYSALACTIQPASGKTIYEFSKRNMQVSHTCYVAPTTTNPTVECKTGDIAVHATKGTYTVIWHEDMAGKGRVFALHLLKK
jgi:hypothetical protein